MTLVQQTTYFRRAISKSAPRQQEKPGASWGQHTLSIIFESSKVISFF